MIFAKVKIPKSWDAKLFTNEKKRTRKKQSRQYGN